MNASDLLADLMQPYLFLAMKIPPNPDPLFGALDVVIWLYCLGCFFPDSYLLLGSTATGEQSRVSGRPYLGLGFRGIMKITGVILRLIL